jgi:M6 family metalloprotease-like protein
MRAYTPPAVAVLGLVFLAACSDGTPTGPSTGTLEITTSTTGQGIDLSGYLVVIDGNPGPVIGVNSSVSIADLRIGSHQVAIGGIPANCGVAGDNPRAVVVTAGAGATAAFHIECQAIGGDPPYRVSPTGVRVHGTTRVLVIPARFADGAPEPVSAAVIREQLFGGPHGGPVAEAYRLASTGSFELLGVVAAWVTTSITLTAASTPGSPAFTDYLVEAIQAADEHIDFGHFDNDGPDGIPNSGDDDGVVDGGVVILNSERNRYCDGGTGTGPHPHAVLNWRPGGARYRTQDPAHNGGVIEIGAYTAMAATGCTSSTVAAHIIAHELGHVFFGLPDLYHQLVFSTEPWTVRRWVLGCWELMSAGTWGCGGGTPNFTDARIATFGAWTRAQIGWVTPAVVPVALDASYDLHPLARGGTVLRVPIRADEYLLIEYRERAAGDDLLPADGVLMYHVAESRPFPAQTGAYRVSLVEADDDNGLVRTHLEGGDRGMPGDAFGLGRTSFRRGEHSRAVATDGSPLPFSISEITIDAGAGKARLRVSPASLP